MMRAPCRRRSDRVVRARAVPSSELLVRAAKSAAAHLPEAAGPAVERLDRLARRGWWRHVREWRRLIAESERWPVERIERYQLDRLQRQLRHAYEHVPYYRSMFDRIGARPDDVRTLDDLHELPTLSKRHLQEHLGDLLATNFTSAQRKYFTSGGSTGIPVGFYQDRARTSAAEWAFMTSQWQRVGYRDGDRSAVFRGSVTRHGTIEFDPFRNALVMSSYHLTDEVMPSYLERLRAFRPRYIQAYPSSITLLARFMRTAGEPPVEGVATVLCGSENLYDWQRSEIEAAFDCRVFSWYGQSECVCLAGECETSAKLHIFPQYGVTELVGERGEAITVPGTIGEIVGTGFLTESMPLIRYRTADLASYAAASCEGCGRPYRLFDRIEGRLQEFIVTGGGRFISMAAINMHSPVFDNVQQFRFYQDTPGRVALRLVPKSTYGPADEGRIHAELAPKLGDDVALTLEQVEEIRATPRGKHHFIDQRLPSPFADGASEDAP
jgi:phenylacetate-CoA ligase